MRRPSRHLAFRLCAYLCLALGRSSVAGAQSIPAASRDVIPSAFGAITGTYTGLDGGRNLGITAGLDIGLRPFLGFFPSLEGRGTYPINSGQIVGERHAEGGLRLQKRYGPLRPYANFLFGRGELNYQNGGYPVPQQSFRYLRTTTTVLSPGLGVEVDLNPHVALLLDGQFQIWSVPFDPSGQTANSGHLFSFPGTIGAVYRFNWLEHGHAAGR